MATHRAAPGRCGIDSEIGSLTAASGPTSSLLDGDTPELAAIHDPFQQVVYCATARCVSDVWVDGVRRVPAGRVVDADLGRAGPRGAAPPPTSPAAPASGAESVYAGPGRIGAEEQRLANGSTSA